MFAICPPGVEGVTAGELAALGVAGEIDRGGVAFQGGWSELIAANLQLRTASRILVRIAEFKARSFIELERHARKIDWTPWVRDGSAVELRVGSRKSKLYHERAIAERFAKWIGEATGASAAGGTEPDDEEDIESVNAVHVRVFRDRVQVSVDSSGAHLRLRGYRKAVAKAPLRETLASACLLASGWDGGTSLFDPFCGSGTILIEGALMARRIPPGLASPDRHPREFAFEQWSGFPLDFYQDSVADLQSRIADSSPSIAGSDRDAGAIEAALANAGRAGVDDSIDFEVAAISSADPPASAGHLVTNPPYGVRVGEARKLRDLYAAFGKLSRTRFSGWTIGILQANPELMAVAGMEGETALRTSNGGIEVRLEVRPPLAGGNRERVPPG